MTGSGFSYPLNCVIAAMFLSFFFIMIGRIESDPSDRSDFSPTADRLLPTAFCLLPGAQNSLMYPAVHPPSTVRMCPFT